MSDTAATTVRVTKCETADAAPGPREAPREELLPPALVDADLLVEDVSIDGMCGVY
jgi:mycofactocin precursor